VKAELDDQIVELKRVERMRATTEQRDARSSRRTAVR
jgi:hypothetical protein